MAKIGDNIRLWMGKKGIGFMQLAERGNIPESTLSNWLHSKYEPNAKKLSIIAKVLDITVEDLFHSPFEESNPDPKPKEKLVPVLGYAACGTPVETWEDAANRYIDAGEIKGLVTPFILEAKGRSMFPYIYEKDKLLCSTIQKEQLKDEMLVVVAFKTNPGSAEANAKLITPKKDSCILYSVNANFKPVEVLYSQIHKIYKVVRILRDIK